MPNVCSEGKRKPTLRRKPKLQDGEDEEEAGAPAPPLSYGALPPRALYQPPPGGAQPHP